MTKRSVHIVGRPERHAFWEQVPFHHESPKPKQGDVYDMTVSNVCEDCNNGWMNQIHVAAAPLVVKLADGCWQVHSEEQCATLSRWITMVAINLEYQGRIVKTPQHQRSALMNGRMPEGWKIGFGNLREPRRGSRFQPMALPMDMGDGEPLYFNNCWFCIERAVFHSRNSWSVPTLELASLGAGLSEIRLPTTPLWPSAGRTVEELFRGGGLDDLGIQRLEVN